ncbi:hypothetical protein CVS40_11664, partial [Lucilia cuprina]
KFLFDCDHLLTFCSNFTNVEIQDQTDSILETKLSDLDNRWNKLQISYEKLMIAPSSMISKDLKEKAKVNFNACSETFYSCKSNIMDMLRITRISPTSHNISSRLSLPLQPFPPQSSSIHIKLPPCDTEIFEGSYEKWPSFRDMFTAVYINGTSCPHVVKLFHLRNKTANEAGAFVKRYPLCDDSFELAWNALKARYENKRVLVDHQLQILFNIPVASSEDSKTLQKIHSTVTDVLQTLKTLNVNTENCDFFIVYLVCSKLPNETLALWEQSLKSHQNLNSPCKQRIDFVTANKICNNCVSPNNLKSKCPSKNTCFICSMNHHTSLHIIKPNISRNQSNTSNPSDFDQTISSQSKNNSNEATYVPIELPTYSKQVQNPRVQANVSVNTEHILLRTAIVHIEHLGKLFTVKALINVCGLASAYNTIFGWVLSGPIIGNPIHSFTTTTVPSETSILNDLLRKFREQEELPSPKHLSKEDQYCEQFYKETTIRQADGRYVERLPFKKEFPNFIFLDYLCLLNSQQIPNKSPLKTLNPFLDSNKIKRVNGRLSESSLPYNERYPIILPGNSRRQNQRQRDPAVHLCLVCKQYHALRFCRRFLNMTIQERIRMVRPYNYCGNCLARSHNLRSCSSLATCRKCDHLHHTLLHPARGRQNDARGQIYILSSRKTQALRSDKSILGLIIPDELRTNNVQFF